MLNLTVKENEENSMKLIKSVISVCLMVCLMFIARTAAAEIRPGAITLSPAIAGYTSASGTEAYNQKLSERRANAVKAYLANEGIIAPDRLSTIGYGETNPAMHEAAPKEIYSKAAKANMRVLFEVIVK
jgi:hypothetical protein